MRSALAFVAFLFFVAPALAAAAQPNAFQVSVYANLDTAPDSIPYDEIDEVVLAFLNPTDGCGGFSQTSYPGIQAITSAAKAQSSSGHKTKVTFAIGGGGNKPVDALLESIAASADCRTQFAGQVAAIIKQNGLDGVDIDWEFPETASLGNYTLFIEALRQAIGKKTLSIAIYDNAGKDDPAAWLTPDVFPYVDYYLVMAYLAPRNAAIKGWVNPPWNLPESQLRLGLAFFGNPPKGAGVGYKDLLGSVSASMASPCSDKVGKYQINGLRTTRELTRFAMAENLGGITGWELGQDRTDSISLLSAASEIDRMWEGFAQWQSGKTYAAGTIVQNDGNLWLVKSSSKNEPSLTNTAFQQYEVMNAFSEENYYCGGEEVWFGDTVYRAVQDPALSVPDLSPMAAPSLWKKLYAAPLYDDAATFQKGDRVFFNGSIYTATRKTVGVSPAKASPSWTPFVDTDAFDPTKSYAAGVTVRYMGNQYVSSQSSKGAIPVETTDTWQPVRK